MSSPAPTPYRWTISEYRKLGKTGLFHNRKTMLIHGEFYVLKSHGPAHDLTLGLTDDYLRTSLPSGHHIRCQMSLDIGIDNDPGPDLAIIQGGIRDYATRNPTTAVMVVEVSDWTLSLDTTTKAELYATAGVPEYWVFDLPGRRLLVFRDPTPLPAGLGATAYQTQLIFGPTDTVAPLAVPTAAVTVADLLP